MEAFLDIALGYPTIIWTVLLAGCFVFWVVILSGGFGVDALDGHADLDGHVDLHVEGDVHADVHPDTHSDAEVDGVSHGDIHGAGWMGFFLGFLGVGRIPVTIVASLLILESWFVSMLINYSVTPFVAGLMHWAVWGTLMLVFTAFLGAIVAGFSTRPLRGAFKVHTVHGDEHLVDEIVTIRTKVVTDKTGQAEYKTTGAPMILTVRCPRQNNLKKGDQAVIINFDKENRTYEVAALLPDEAKPKRDVSS